MGATIPEYGVVDSPEDPGQVQDLQDRSRSSRRISRTSRSSSRTTFGMILIGFSLLKGGYKELLGPYKVLIKELLFKGAPLRGF